MSRQDDAPGSATSIRDGIGEILTVGGGYRLLNRVGRGAFGEVWRAAAPGGVDVAVKLISRTVKPDEARREMEALEIIKQLRHQHLLGMQAFYALPDRLIIILELADESLRGRLRACEQSGHGLPPDELLHYTREAAEGLDYLHAQKVQHRDVKPDNLLLLANHVKVADFGLARVLETVLLQTASVSGTPAYMAPEIWSGKVSPHTDQYSLALCYAELRLGWFPLAYKNLAHLMYAHLHGQAQLDSLPEAEQAVLRRALAKEPAERYPSCTAFAAALDEACRLAPPGEGVLTITAGPMRIPTLPPAFAQAPTQALGSHPVEAPTGLPGQGDEDSWTVTSLGEFDPKSPTPPGLGNEGIQKRPLSRILHGLTVGYQRFAGVIGWIEPPDQIRHGLTVGGAISSAVVLVVLLWLLFGGRRNLQMVRILEGTLTMGTDEVRSEAPKHSVTIGRAFWIAAHKTTQEQFRKVLGRNPSYFSSNGLGREKVAWKRTDRFPVESVTFYDAIEYCNELSELEGLQPCYWLDAIERRSDMSIRQASVEPCEGTGYRLPSEAVWEYCARAGTTTWNWFGDKATDLGEYEWFRENSAGRTHPVGEKKPNPWGLYDVGGLAKEWCEDVWHDDYKGAPAEGRAWRTGGDSTQRVVRGGSWKDGYRSPHWREARAADSRQSDLGFRVVRVTH
jgi:formylglycine-generating enzyme required for sulfatase activity/serine/threonine protein kinase